MAGTKYMVYRAARVQIIPDEPPRNDHLGLIHVGTVEATTPENAIAAASDEAGPHVVIPARHLHAINRKRETKQVDVGWEHIEDLQDFVGARPEDDPPPADPKPGPPQPPDHGKAVRHG